MTRFRLTSLACVSLLGGLLLWLSIVPPAISDDGRSDDDMSAVTPEREAAAKLFAERHHPELAALLGSLREMNRQEYEKAIQELFATSERLARLMGRVPERYELELAVWKVDSRIRLLAARSAMNESAGARDALKELLLEKSDLRLQLLQFERERLAARVDRLDSSIAELQDDREAAADKELERLLRSARAQANRRNRERNQSRGEDVTTRPRNRETQE